MAQRMKFLWTIIAGTIVIASGALATVYVIGRQSGVPGDIQNRLDFKPFVLTAGAVVAVDASTYKYDSSQKLLSFVANSNNLGKLTFSEQTTPPQFIDIQDYYPKLVDTLNRYSAFDNQFGTVYLTRPKGQQAGQTAIMNASGVLMFVRSEKDLSDEQWRRVFNALQLQT